MRIGVPRESGAGERRVALAPDSAARLVKAGVEVAVERGAGVPANFPDEAYTKAGAAVGDTAGAWGADVVVKVQKPTGPEARQLSKGAILISLLPAATSPDLLQQLASQGGSSLGLEKVP